MFTHPLEEVKPNEAPVSGEAIRGASDPVQHEGAVTFPIADVAETPRADALNAAHAKEFNRPKASIGEVLTTNIKGWDTTRIGSHLLDKLKPSDLEPTAADPNFNIEDFIYNAKIPLTEDDRKWLRKKGIKSQEEADQYLTYLEDSRERAKVSADRPILAFGTQMLDPMYYISGSAAFGAARALNLSRKAALATGAAFETGAVSTADMTRPVSTSEYVIAALIGGALNGIVHSPVPKAEWVSPFTMQNIASNLSPVGRFGVTAKLNKAIAEDMESYQKALRSAEFEVTQISNTNTEFMHVPRFELTEIGGNLQYVRSQNTIVDTIKGVKQVPAVRAEVIEVGKMASRFEPTPVSKTRPAATTVLQGIVDNPKVPQVLRDIAKQMQRWGGKQLEEISTQFNVNFRRPNVMGEYHPMKHSVKVRGGKRSLNAGNPNTVSTTLHEVMHGLTSLKYHWGKRNPNTAHGKIVKEIDDLFVKASRSANKAGLASQPFAVRYGFTNPREFMAVLVEGNPDFYRFLEKLDLPEGTLPNTFQPTLVGEMYDSMRRLLGLDLEQANTLTRALDLSDQLAKTPARYVYEMPDGAAPTVRKISPDASEADIARLTEKEVTETIAANQRWNEKLGNKLAWNLYKTVSKIDPKTAELWLSDPMRTNARGNISSTKRAIRAEFADAELRYHTAVRQALFDSGLKWWEFIVKPSKVRAVQDQLHRDVMDVLLQWENQASKGITRSEGKGAVYEAAKAFDDTMRIAGKAGEESGIFNRGLTTQHGYIPRRFNASRIADIEDALTNFFKGDTKKARAYLAEQLSRGFRQMGDMTPEDYKLLAAALLDRARRKGELQDVTFRGHMGLEVLAEIKDVMVRQGAKPRDVNRVLEILEGKVEEAGKASYQKSRLDLNMTAQLTMPDGTVFPMREIMDHNLTSLMSNYLDDVSGRIAMSEFGIKNTGDIDKARQAFVSKARGENAKREANDLFENIVNDILGRPVGEVMPDWLRGVQMMTTMLSLRNSGFWQVTEYAKAYQRYSSIVGHGLVTHRIFGSFKGMRDALKDVDQARTLEGILSRNSYNDLRLRPFIDKLDDGHMLGDNPVITGMKHAQQYVYVANGMSYIQRHQSIMAANLVVDTLGAASKGNVKARDFFKKFGFDDELIDSIGDQIKKHGNTVDKWDGGVWAKVRAPLQTIMDEDVLRARLGEIPAIAQFSTAGKILFTFRSFVLSSHNKILANGLANDGVKAMSIFYAYQFALSSLMVQVAQASRSGEVITDRNEWAKKTVAMMGGIGLLADGIAAFTGESKQFGSPFLMSVDRVYRLANQTGSGEFQSAALTAADSVPLVSLLPAWGAAMRAILGE